MRENLLNIDRDLKALFKEEQKKTKESEKQAKNHLQKINKTFERDLMIFLNNFNILKGTKKEKTDIQKQFIKRMEWTPSASDPILDKLEAEKYNKELSDFLLFNFDKIFQKIKTKKDKEAKEEEKEHQEEEELKEELEEEKAEKLAKAIESLLIIAIAPIALLLGFFSCGKKKRR